MLLFHFYESIQVPIMSQQVNVVKDDSTSDSGQKDFGVRGVEMKEKSAMPPKKPTTSHQKSQRPMFCRRSTPANTTEMAVISRRRDELDAKIDRISKEIREVLNVVKSMQMILLRVTSSGAQGHFSSTGSYSNPPAFFMH